MQAIRLSLPAQLDNLRCVELPDPGAPGPGQIRVRLHASSLNYHDYAVVTGQMPTADGRIPMSDGAGVVEALGEGVADFQVGDAVVSCFFPGWDSGAPTTARFSSVPGDGVDGYARQVVLAAAEAFTRAPRGYSHAEAATLTTAGLTAWRALVVEGNLKAGDTVLVLGSGGVSVFALQLAKAMGATVIATTSSAAKEARLRELGADHVINYREVPQWGERVLALTAGRGVDQVIEVGGPGTLAESIKACRIGGFIALIGVLTGWQGAVPTGELMGRQQRLQGLVVGNREQQLALIRALEASGVRPVIDRTFALAEIAEAFRYQESGQHVGKICLAL